MGLNWKVIEDLDGPCVIVNILHVRDVCVVLTSTSATLGPILIRCDRVEAETNVSAAVESSSRLYEGIVVILIPFKSVHYTSSTKCQLTTEQGLPKPCTACKHY